MKKLLLLILLALITGCSCSISSIEPKRKYPRGTIVYINKDGYAVDCYLNDSLVMIRRLDCKSDFCSVDVRESLLLPTPTP